MQRTMSTLHCFKAVISTTNDLEKTSQSNSDERSFYFFFFLIYYELSL